MLAAALDNRVGRALFGELVDRLEEPRGLRRLAGDLLADYEREVFGTRDRGRWEGDDPATQRAKNSGRVLVDTGNLLEELTHPLVEGDEIRVEAGDATYAIHLQRGAGNKMPPRDPAPAPSYSQVEDWAAQILGYLTNGA